MSESERASVYCIDKTAVVIVMKLAECFNGNKTSFMPKDQGKFLITFRGKRGKQIMKSLCLISEKGNPPLTHFMNI